MTAASADVLFLPEPSLTFAHGQALEDPRDGLTLFGPLDAGRPYGIRAGVIGTPQGIDYFRAWAVRLQGYLADQVRAKASRPPFPGFETVFRIPWRPDPIVAIAVPEAEIHAAVHLEDRHQRVHRTVSVFTDRLVAAQLEDDAKPDLWFVVIPDIIHKYCRPQSVVGAEVRIKTRVLLGPRLMRRAPLEPFLLDELNRDAVAYQYDVNFHHQLKARLLQALVLTQVIRESTIAPAESGLSESLKRTVHKRQAEIAWNLTTATFYKAGGRPWKIDGIRDGVCYIGLAFKQDLTQGDPRSACCAAQMFLDSGDGLVFRGAVGPWYAPEKKEFHIDSVAARELVDLAVKEYSRRMGGPPRELFIHGSAAFSAEEWRGFTEAIDEGKTRLVGIKIQTERDLRFFRLGAMPVLRGLAFVLHEKAGYVWTRGYTPRLQTYVGREVPRPLRIDILRGEADMRTVLADIMALTKVNYNACILGDGMPVTLRFANAVGEILTAGPVPKDKPLPFRHYI